MPEYRIGKLNGECVLVYYDSTGKRHRYRLANHALERVCWIIHRPICTIVVRICTTIGSDSPPLPHPIRVSP